MRACTAPGSTPCDDASSTLCADLVTTRVGEPDAGNLHVRFDEGEQLTAAPYSTVVLARSAKREAQPWARSQRDNGRRPKRLSRRQHYHPPPPPPPDDPELLEPLSLLELEPPSESADGVRTPAAIPPAATAHDPLAPAPPLRPPPKPVQDSEAGPDRVDS